MAFFSISRRTSCTKWHGVSVSCPHSNPLQGDVLCIYYVLKTFILGTYKNENLLLGGEGMRALWHYTSPASLLLDTVKAVKGRATTEQIEKYSINSLLITTQINRYLRDTDDLPPEVFLVRRDLVGGEGIPGVRDNSRFQTGIAASSGTCQFFFITGAVQTGFPFSLLRATQPNTVAL